MNRSLFTHLQNIYCYAKTNYSLFTQWSSREKKRELSLKFHTIHFKSDGNWLAALAVVLFVRLMQKKGADRFFLSIFTNSLLSNYANDK